MMSLKYLKQMDLLKILLELIKITILSLPSTLRAFYYIFVARPQKIVKGEIVLVTGAGQGMGRELSLRLARLGSKLICVDILPEGNLETVRLIQEAGGTARGYVCDVADRQAVVELEKAVGRVDILINNAGIYPIRGLLNATEVELRTIVNVNLMSQFWMVQAFMPGMKSRDHGHIVAVSSIAALYGAANLMPYSASKAGVTAFMQSLHHEMRIEGRANIKLTTAHPYFVKTRQLVSECVESRLPMLEVEEAVDGIVEGILEEAVSFTVPRVLSTLLNLTYGSNTQAYKDYFFNAFYPEIREPKVDPFKQYMEDGLFNQVSHSIQQQ